jgi:hypothetical protein
MKTSDCRSNLCVQQTRMTQRSVFPAWCPRAADAAR